VLHGVKAGAIGEHPAGKDTLDLSAEFDLVHLDEGCGVRRLRGRAGIADTRRHFQRSELDGLIDGDLKMRDAPGHLVEGCKHRDRVLNIVGARVWRAQRRQGCRQNEQER
jgi:hypothetical protein